MSSYYEKILATGEVKCIDEEIPFEVPKGWEWCRLSNIGITETGTTPSKTHPEYFGDYIPFLGPANILDDKIVRETQGLSFEGVKYGRVIPANSILQVCIGGSIGKCAIVHKEVTFNQQINSLTPIKCCVDYVHYVLQSETFRLAIIAKATGTATPIINRGNWEQLLFPLPPLVEQHRIVAKLNELKDIIAHYSETQIRLQDLNNGIKSRLSKSILQEAIQGKLVPQDPSDEPASILLQRVRDEKQRLVKEGKLKKKDVIDSTIFRGDDNKYYEQIGHGIVDVSDEIPFDLPESWQWTRLGRIVRMSIGKTPARGDASYWAKATKPWVSISDMADYSHIKTTKEKISDAAASTLMGSISPRGSLLMSFKLTVGRTSILDIEAYHNEAIISIYPYIDEEFALRDFLFYSLPILANMGDSKDAIKGKTLNSKSLNSLLIPLPPLNEQRHIIKRLEELYARL